MEEILRLLENCHNHLVKVFRTRVKSNFFRVCGQITAILWVSEALPPTIIFSRDKITDFFHFPWAALLWDGGNGNLLEGL